MGRKGPRRGGGTGCRGQGSRLLKAKPSCLPFEQKAQQVHLCIWTQRIPGAPPSRPVSEPPLPPIPDVGSPCSSHQARIQAHVATRALGATRGKQSTEGTQRLGASSQPHSHLSGQVCTERGGNVSPPTASPSSAPRPPAPVGQVGSTLSSKAFVERGNLSPTAVPALPLMTVDSL